VNALGLLACEEPGDGLNPGVPLGRPKETSLYPVLGETVACERLRGSPACWQSRRGEPGRGLAVASGVGELGRELGLEPTRAPAVEGGDVRACEEAPGLSWTFLSVPGGAGFFDRFGVSHKGSESPKNRERSRSPVGGIEH
jgi:hypothetical protein